jgi:hypothetical protein
VIALLSESEVSLLELSRRLPGLGQGLRQLFDHAIEALRKLTDLIVARQPASDVVAALSNVLSNVEEPTARLHQTAIDRQ